MTRRIVRPLQGIALIGAFGAGAIALLLARGGFEALDAAVTLVLLAPAAIVLFFSYGVRELLALPERLRRLPDEGGQRLADLARIAGEARSTRTRGLPLLLWRLRGALGSLRDVAGIALPLRVLTPGLLGLSAIAAAFCIALGAAGLVAVLVLAA